MVTKRRTWLLLAALVLIFAAVGVAQWGIWGPGPAGDSGGASVGGNGAELAQDGAAPDASTTLNNVMLIYADAINHVAGRYLEAESYETAILLLERVVRVRRGVLGPDDPGTLEAEARWQEALLVSRGAKDADAAAGGG